MLFYNKKKNRNGTVWCLNKTIFEMMYSTALLNKRIYIHVHIYLSHYSPQVYAGGKQ